MIVKNLSKRVKNLDFFDLVSVILSSFFLGIVLVRFVPALADTNPWWWAALIFLFAIRPKFRFWIKKPE